MVCVNPALVQRLYRRNSIIGGIKQSLVIHVPAGDSCAIDVVSEGTGSLALGPHKVVSLGFFALFSPPCKFHLELLSCGTHPLQLLFALSNLLAELILTSKLFHLSAIVG
jgi:hypothetical protein